ncbi:MAG: type II secretion system protein [Planctomycetota bacterium]|nr:type II secretion system protein [Planctomycetota bacterium]
MIVDTCQKDRFSWRDGYTFLELMVVVSMLAILLTVALPYVFPHLLEARKAENERSVMTSLRSIASCQTQFREGDREGDGFLDYATSLKELSQVGLIDNVLGGGVMSGYVFTLSGSTFVWRCFATPISDRTGNRHFIIRTDGVVYSAPSGVAIRMSSECFE